MLSRSVPRHRRRAALASILLAALAGGAWADAAAAQGSATVLICEATGNPSAPYVEIRVNQSDLGNYSAGEGDIIPAPAAGCPGTAAAVTTTSAVTTSTTSTSTATASATTTSAAAHKHKTASSGTKGSSSNLAATNPAVQTSATESATESTTEFTPATTTLQTLPRTGGQVPLTVSLGLLALLGGALLRWALVRPRTRRGRSGS